VNEKYPLLAAYAATAGATVLPESPHHLLLGHAAYDFAMSKVDELRK
jgi:hypothetical protein